jgi:hypothetical protein
MHKQKQCQDSQSAAVDSQVSADRVDAVAVNHKHTTENQLNN